jgi:NTE family protein/lysophospholipid hydrolase
LFSLVGSRKLDRVLQDAHGNSEIEDLWLRFFCVSSNLSLNQAMVHDSGSLWRALRASSALPGIVLPVVSREGLLVDGGLVNNLPGDLMREFCRTVIVVNVSSSKEIQRHQRRFPSPWQVVMAHLLPFREAVRAPNILDVLMGSTMLSSAGRARRVISDADLCFEPPIEDFGMLEFTALEELVDIGHRHAAERIASWLEERPHPWLSDSPG